MGPSDDDLFCAYRETRDSDAFETLFHRHSARIFRFAWGMTGDAASAEEIMQEVFLKVSQSADDYEPQGRFGAWLMRIARNRCLNHIESRRLRRMEPAGEEIESPVRSPLERLAASDECDRLQRAILKLPPAQREAILLYAMQDMSYRHIAQVLDVPVNTVKTLIYQARLALARCTRGEP